MYTILRHVIQLGDRLNINNNKIKQLCEYGDDYNKLFNWPFSFMIPFATPRMRVIKDILKMSDTKFMHKTSSNC